MAVETSADLAEWLADQAGVYGDYRCDVWDLYGPDFIGPIPLYEARVRDQYPLDRWGDHVNNCHCRVAWVPWVTQRIRDAVATERALDSGPLGSTWMEVDHSQVGVVVLALAHLAVERPGWDTMLKEIAQKLGDPKLVMYEDLKGLSGALCPHGYSVNNALHSCSPAPMPGPWSPEVKRLFGRGMGQGR